MKVKTKTISAWTKRGFDKKMKKFLLDPSIEMVKVIVNVEHSSLLSSYSADISYKDKTKHEL